MRVSRTAPGRRALQLALLVGGVLALALLCGQRAQAAEGAPSAPSPAPSLTSVVTATVTANQEPPLPDVLTPHREPGAARKPVVGAVPVVDGVGEVVRSVTGTVGDTVTRTVTSPVVTALTETLTETVRQVTELPAVPVVQLPEVPVVSDPPAGSEPAPVTPAPGPTQAQPRTPVTHDAGHEKPRTQAATEAAAATAASYGPRSTAAVTFTSGREPHTGTHRAGRATGAPAHPAPAGDPDGALGKSAVDGAASRHTDAHAVTFADRAPLSLVPGAAARLDAAGTRDRYRDIPLFPG
ncbi:MAG: hypothetical protein JF597_38720 [Streptomyces sp.]|uniref:hypothetical protein n=1 Tax=Streptomyces sp. TaxID=1931 RepID=UPI0025FC15A8|nr:hypothetical protein [Streptomyces sp.]MBW8799293.1 hypothetical protein [Streptomyces sp.]